MDMSFPYAYTPQVWPPVITVLVLIALAIYTFRHRRDAPGALPFTFAILFGALWMVGISLEVAAVDTSVQIFWIKFQALWLLPSATAVTCFLLDYAWPGRWLTRRNLVLLSIPCLLNIVMILTNHLHHLAWQGFALDGEVIPLNGLGNWVFLVYVYGLGLLNLVVLGWLFIRSPQHRWPVALILAGQIAGRMVYALGATQVIYSYLPIEVVAFWFPILTYVIALFGFRILNPVPLAQQTAIEQLRDGVLVLDPQERVVRLNPAAELILDAPLKCVKGKQVSALLSGLTERGLPLTRLATPINPLEVSIRLKGEARSYELNFSPLHDFRGLPVGYLLLLHDETEQKRAQAQLLEQQRALDMLQEREQLARELHDGLGQAFAFVNTQGQAIRRLLSRGDIATADEYTSRLVEVAREADVDIRESILGLRAALSGKGFFPVLVQYLAQYGRNYGIRTELEKPETMQDRVFEPLIEIQLLRILQEALTNVRKHASADCVRITFAFERNCATVTIQDDGQGFDLGEWSGDLTEHVGLRVMRERAEEVGGVLRVESSPGKGTLVIIEVPVEEKRG